MVEPFESSNQHQDLYCQMNTKTMVETSQRQCIFSRTAMVPHKLISIVN